jgi:hypothetical protein
MSKKIFTDDYEEVCKRDEVNRKARERCSYTLWHDQSVAEMLRPYTCVILDPSAEGGMPHTRAPAIVCLPAYYPKDRIEKTMKHERVHLDQRTNIEKWKKKLEQEGWIEQDEEVVPEEWRKRCRLNPDTYYCRFFAWEGRYIPLPLFIRIDKPNLKEIEVRWWDKKEERLNKLPPISYTKRYGNRNDSEMEHPFELFAYSMEDK